MKLTLLGDSIRLIGYGTKVPELLGDGEPLPSLDEYVENLLRAAKILLARYGKVIFATTTPFHPAHSSNLNSERRNKIIAEYSDFAR